MTFLTAEECGALPQVSGSRPKAQPGMGGLLTMQELTSLKNFYVEPPGLQGLGITASDLVRGELETPKTLLQTTTVDMIEPEPARHAPRGRPTQAQLQQIKARRAAQGRGRGRGRGRGEQRGVFQQLQQFQKRGVCQTEIDAARAAREALQDCAKTNLQAGIAPSMTSKKTSASEAGILSGLGQPVPVRDLARGEYTHAQQMLSLPQALQAVPVRDLVHGEYMSAPSMISRRQAFGGMGQPVPRGDFVPGELVSGKTLVDHAQGFNGLGLPVRDLKRGEYERASRLIAQKQGFGDWLPIPGSSGTMATQGSWLSPDQVPAWDRESGATLASQKQNFGGLGDNAMPRRDFVEDEIESASRMLRGKQSFGGLHDWIPMQIPMQPTSNGMATQGSWLSPSQVPGMDLESGDSLASQRQNFGGMGDNAVPRRDFVPSELMPASKITSRRQSFGGMGEGYANPSQLNFAPICDPTTGACIRYAAPQEVQASIGQKIEGQSALVKSQMQLPAFYSHPQLGPWGVDPRTAYQYWWQQQANMQQAATPAPLSIWGSPGFISPTPPLPASPDTRAAAFDPYAGNYPVAGTAVERF